MTFTQKPIKPEWLEKDVRTLGLAKSALPLDHKTVSDLLTVWEQGSVKESRALGFGATRYELTLPGGYVGMHITFVAYQDSVVALSMRQQTWTTPSVLDRLIEAWGDIAQRDANSIWYEYRNPGGLGQLQDAISQALGSCEIELSAQHQQAYAVLTDPLEKYDYGTFCYFAGVPPEGRKAVQHLLAAPASGVIRAVLRSAHPEARVYALEAMLELGRRGVSIAEVDWDAMRKIVELEIPICVCEGCIVSQRTAREIFGDALDRMVKGTS